MKYKQTMNAQPAVFVGWWDGEDAFLEGNIYSPDGRSCLVAEGDEVPTALQTHVKVHVGCASC